MSTTIDTGTVVTSGSTTYVSGSSSGIDTEALVEAGYEAKLAAADSIDVKITENESIISAYEELQSLSQDLIDALDPLKTTYGYSSTDDSVYTTREAYLASSDGNNVDSYLGVTVESTAEQTSYSISIVQLATSMKVSSTSQSSKTDALGLEGSFSLNLTGSTAVDISVTSDMSLNDIADAINAETASTGVVATIIKSSDSSYTLMLSGIETGQEIVYSPTAGADILQQLGITDGNGDYTNVIQEAQEAIITVDGVEVTSLSNTIEDVVEGVSITLYGVPADTNTAITLDIDYDYTATKDAIEDFIDAYNSLRDFFITQQSTSSDGTASDDAVLYSDTLLKTLINSIYSIVNGSFGDSDTISTLADMGITFDNENKLVISDEAALNSALLEDYEDVQALFQSSVVTDSDDLAVLRNSSTQSSLDFDLDITVDSDGNIVSASVNGDTTAFTVSGTRLVGAEGTIYEGLTLVYVGTESSTVNVSFSQGLADSLYNLLDSYANSTSGIIQDKINRLEDEDNLLQIKSDRIKERAEAYRERLIEKYSAMETAIASAESLLNQVQALFGTSSSDD